MDARPNPLDLRITLTLTCAALMAACESGGDAGQTLQSQLRDSAGVAIVENARPAPGSRLGWRVGEVPSLSIGIQEGEDPYQFYGVEDATRLADGRIAVANSGSSEVRIFAADGRHLASWGGVGEGPGEFAQFDPEVISIWPGDSIVGAAWWRGQMEVFDARGEPGRTATLGEGYFSFAGLLPDGTVLGKPSLLIGIPFGAGGSTLLRQEQEFALIRPDGELRASLGIHAGMEWFASPTSPSARPHPFGRSVLSTVWGDLAVVALTDRYVLPAYASDGTLKRIIHRDHDLRSPTQAEVDTWITERYADLPEERRTRGLAESEGMTPVEFFPAFSSLQSDLLDFLWVREYNFPEQDENIWTVFDADGRVQGFMETPAEVDVFEIGEDYILSGTTDELGVERVQLWPLDRTPG